MSLKFKPSIAASPIFGGRSLAESLKEKFSPDEIIRIGSNENPLPPSPLVVEAIQSAATTINRYPSMGDDELRAALASATGHGLEAENFFTGNGGSDILAMVAGSFLGPGDECIICRPTFPIYDVGVRRMGANVVYADLDPDNFSYDVEAILGAVTENTRLVYICSPNNPTGNIISAQQMETLVNNLPAHVLLVSDEVYHHFVTADDAPDSLAYVREGKNLVVVHSFSKAFGLAGLRFGYGIAPPEIVSYVSRMRQPFHLDKLTMEAGLAGLRDTEHIKKTVKLVVEGRQWLSEQLAGLGLQVWPGQGNFILFKPPLPAADVAEQLLQEGIIVRPLAGFYMPDHVRVSIGLPEENERFVAGLRKLLELSQK